MNVNQLLRDIDWALGLGDELAEQQRPIGKRHTYGAPRVREGYFAKGTASDDEDDEPDDHASIKSKHHAAMSELYEGIAGRHAKMARHYQGAHKDAGAGDDEGAHHFQQDEELSDPVAIVAKAMRAGVHYGDPSRSGYHLTRAREGWSQ